MPVDRSLFTTLGKDIRIIGPNSNRSFLKLSSLLLLVTFFCLSSYSARANSINDQHQSARVLVNDLIFPNTMAAWRLNAIEAFINSFDTDILVLKRISNYANINFAFEWLPLIQSHHLYKYDLLIFNSELNHLNYVNQLNRTKDDIFDGTKYNGLSNGDYMLRLKKYRNSDVDLNAYAGYYHIFVSSFDLLQRSLWPIRTNGSRNIVHCYPGGGFNFNEGMRPMKKYEGVTFIATQVFVTEVLQRDVLRWMKIKVIDIYGVPLLRKNEKFPVRSFDTEHNYLRVCFTSLGDPEMKGLPHYIELSNYFKRHFPLDNITFYLVGLRHKEYGNDSNLVHIPQMSQANLNKFYQENVDIICNLDTTKYLNGWPLGVEAVLTGALLLTTDRFNLNERNRFYFNEGLFVADRNNLSEAASWIHRYVNDRRRLQRDSMIIQRLAFFLFNYDAQIQPIIDLTRSIISS